MDMLFYTDCINKLKGIFGKPSLPECNKIYKTRIRKNKGEYVCEVKFSFWGKWHTIKRQWFNYDSPLGTDAIQWRSSLHGVHAPHDLEDAENIITNYKKHKGSGITIW